MADETEETKLCTNCKRQISAANFVMHEMHCKRHITLCEHCQEPVPKAELELHFEETHAKIACPKCGLEVEINKLEHHEENECPKRQIKCGYCEMDVAQSELENHMDYCGTRTEACVKCGQFIMMKDLNKHEDSNCVYPPPKPANESSRNQNVTNGRTPGSITGASSHIDPEDMLFGSGDVNPFAFDEISRLLNADGPGASPAFRSTSETSSNLRSRGRPPQPQSRVVHTDISGAQRKDKKAVEKNKANKKSDLNRQRERAAGNPTDRLTNAERDRILALHLAQDLTETDEVEDYLRSIHKPNLNPGHSENDPYSNDYTDLTNHNTDFGDISLLPCEFCGDAIPIDELVLHQSHCSEDPLSSFLPDAASSNNNVESSSDNRYNAVSPETRPTPHVINNLGIRNPAIPEWSLDALEATSAEDVLLPCEFCDELFPQDVLVQHQSVCDTGPSFTPRVMSPAASQQTTNRAAAKASVPSRSRRHQAAPDIGTILTGSRNKNSASGASRGTHSFELDSTLRKYGSSSYDPYVARNSRKAEREQLYGNDDLPSPPVSPKRVQRSSVPRVDSAARTRETLNRLLNDNVTSSSSPSRGALHSASRKNSKDNINSSRVSSQSSNPVPVSSSRSSNKGFMARGTLKSTKTAANARNVQRELDEFNDLTVRPDNSSTSRRTAKPSVPVAGNQNTNRLPSSSNNVDMASGSRQRNRTGNQIFDYRSENNSSRNSRTSRRSDY